jgi:antirestriction protein ArdC
MPPIESFFDAEAFYGTLAHETVHWTKHPSRLERDFGRKKFGDAGYALEEIVAEMGSAFICADLEISPVVKEDHANYIASWLLALQDDNKAVFRAAAFAQKAVDYLAGLQRARVSPELDGDMPEGYEPEAPG